MKKIITTMLLVLSLWGGVAQADPFAQFSNAELIKILKAVPTMDMTPEDKMRLIEAIDHSASTRPSTPDNTYYGLQPWQIMTMTPQMADALRQCYTNQKGERYCKAN